MLVDSQGADTDEAVVGGHQLTAELDYLESGRLLNVVDNRTSAAVSAWISRQPACWRQAVQV